MSRLRAGHDPFEIQGGCTCPGTMTLFQLRISGHTAECTAARRDAVEERQRLRDNYTARPATVKPLRELEQRRDVR